MSQLALDLSGGIRRTKELRYYQREFVDACEAAWGRGSRKLLSVLPTGGGKTLTAGELIARVIEGGGRVLFLAHLRKLVKQGRESIHGGYNIDGGLEFGGRKSNGESAVFATCQTIDQHIKKNSTRFGRHDFDLVVIDECHRTGSPVYKRIMRYFQGRVLGITATPRRSDQVDLMTIFDEMAYDIPISRLISEGYLCDLIIKTFPVAIDVNSVRTKAGDFDTSDLGHAIEPYLESCAKELLNYKGRKMLVFLPLIATSKLFLNYCNRAGLKFRHVDGFTPEGTLEGVISQLRRGEIDGICNSMLLTEGVDIPEVDLLMNLRLTKSWGLYTQIMGRGTRGGRNSGVAPGKENCIVLDPLWLCDEHNMLQRPATLFSADSEEEERVDKKVKEAAEKGDEISLFDASAEFRSQREEALKERLERLSDRKGQTMKATDLFLALGDIDLAEYEPTTAAEKAKVTDRQREIIESKGIDISTVGSRGQASKIIEAIIDRDRAGSATIKQCLYAKDLGMENPWGATKAEVSEYISTHK